MNKMLKLVTNKINFDNNLKIMTNYYICVDE
jgi:hypothetical protein